MRCPHCGYDIKNAHRCLRCGYEVTSVATVDDNGKKNEEPTVKVIDPSQVYIVDTPTEDDYEAYNDPIAALFDDFFSNPINDILNLFGMGVRSNSSRRARSSHQPKEPERRRRNNGPIVEFDDVEILDANDKPIYSKHKKRDDKK